MSNLTNITADGDYVIQGANTTRTVEGIIYFGGDPMTGKATFGYAEPGVFPETFKAFLNGAFSDEKHIKHGRGITLMVRVAGWTGGDIADILYAPS